MSRQHPHTPNQLLALNCQIATVNRQSLHEADVFTVQLSGPPGSGKTALIQATLRALPGRAHAGLITENLPPRVANRMYHLFDEVAILPTTRLHAHHVRRALRDIRLQDLDILFIETSGDFVGPAGLDLGQDVKVSVFGVCAGDDKPAEYPRLVTDASLVVLTQTDLLPHLPFDFEQFEQDVRRLNPTVPLMRVSATAPGGIDAWIEWLEEQRWVKRHEKL